MIEKIAAVLAAVTFAVWLPAMAWRVIRLANELLMDRIPKYDPETTKTRTDIYSMRAAYASFIVGLLMLALWAVTLAALALASGLKILWG
jgi:hypothetical protein